MNIGINAPNLRWTLMHQCSGKYKSFLGFFFNYLEDAGTKNTTEAATCVYQYIRHLFLDSLPPMKTQVPRTPVKLRRVCTNTYGIFSRWYQEPQWSCDVCVPINTAHFLGLSATHEDAGTKNPSEAATRVCVCTSTHGTLSTQVKLLRVWNNT